MPLRHRKLPLTCRLNSFFAISAPLREGVLQLHANNPAKGKSFNLSSGDIVLDSCLYPESARRASYRPIESSIIGHLKVAISDTRKLGRVDGSSRTPGTFLQAHPRQLSRFNIRCSICKNASSKSSLGHFTMIARSEGFTSHNCRKGMLSWLSVRRNHSRSVDD